jgi:predicted nucleic acid-binding protein
LHRPRLKLKPRQIQEALAGIRKIAHYVTPAQTLSLSSHESDNRFLECAEAAQADYLVTGNTRHFPQSHKMTKVVTGRQFLEPHQEEPD